jgi:hypothetical protein
MGKGKIAEIPVANQDALISVIVLSLTKNLNNYGRLGMCLPLVL